MSIKYFIAKINILFIIWSEIFFSFFHMHTSKKVLAERRAIGKKHIDKKIINQIRIFILIITIILWIGIYNICLWKISVILSILGIFLGCIAGFLTGRIGRLSWDTEAEKVISRLDYMSGIFLVLYISVEVGKNWFFGHWLQGDVLSAFVLTFLVGLLFWRVLYVAKGLKQILHQEGKLISKK